MILQLNPPGMVSTEVGYISSITIRYNGANNVLTPDGNNQITLPNATTGALDAGTRILGGPMFVTTAVQGQRIGFVSNAA